MEPDADPARAAPGWDEGPVPSGGPPPLVVGVTGHRDLRPQDAARLEARVRAILLALRQRHPHGALLLLSALAEGADRLVARVALDLGVRLVAPLPLARAQYRRDFATAASVAEFEALLARAEWFELSPAAVPPPRGVGAHHPYAELAAYLARHSHVLLALWDGVTDPEKIGGTATTVRLKREALHATSGALPRTPGGRAPGPSDRGSVIHLVTPRLSNANPVAAPFSVIELR